MQATTLERDRILHSVWMTLRLTFGLVPIVAGLDKFTNLLCVWPKYVAPAFASALPMSPQTFMYVVGVIEIVAGLGVLLPRTTRLFGYVVAGWLVCIAINLIAGGYYDIAVRDLVMAVSAVSYARLTALVARPEVVHAAPAHVAAART